MKLNHILSGVAFLALCLTSCSDQMNYKEFKIDDEEWVKRDFDKVGKITTHIYRDLDYDHGQTYGGAMLASATDEAVYSHQGGSIESYFNGAWSPVTPNSSTWTTCLDAISYCNLYLDRFTGLEFPEHKLEKDYNDQMLKYDNYQWEVRFMRAYFHFLLLRQYGDVPLLTAYMDADEANDQPRVESDKVFEFIDNECEAIKDSIIANYSGAYNSIENETGRVNNLGILALRARAALYHASPLFTKGKSDAEKKELWRLAALRNKECIDACKSRGMGLAKTYESLFAVNNWQGAEALKEIIFARRVADDRAMETRNFPIGMNGAGGGNCPTENLVSAYETKNGLPIDQDPAYDPQNPYVNRDSRLAATVARNGEKWPVNLGRNALEIWYGGANSRSVPYGTPTGYYLKKYVNGDQVISGNKATTSKHTWVLFRLGQVYLDYAEALLNYSGSGYSTPDEFTMSAAEAINLVRERAGQPKLPAGLNFEDFTKRYENERFVELAFEGHRMYDVRRWMKAPQYFEHIKVMEVTKNDDGTITYQTVTDPAYITKRAWPGDKAYLWPLPQAEVLKSGNLTQNEGWER
ncbi:MAG: RagB/SusD family nutrient uptake outer membrane protein [Muribaculaceae bacterium]|nr:RagB/SusD family nutrient uptake outer membrane protein [Muribaculaceae bacterium]